jgi:hypothetical protein
VGVNANLEAIESFESVEGADDKSEKTGGDSGKPVSVSSRNKGDGGDKDSSCFDISSGDLVFLLILFYFIVFYFIFDNWLLC